MAAATAFCALATAAASLVGAQAASLKGVRFGEQAPDATRIVIDLTGAADYAISGDGRGEGRLIIDFASLDVDRRDAAQHKAAGLIEGYRYKARRDGGVRMTFDLKNSAKIDKAFVLDPRGAIKHTRLVIDMKSASKAAFLESLPSRYSDLAAVIEEATGPDDERRQDGARKSERATVKARRPLGRPLVTERAPLPVIVIDPGHGGGDPGAIGPAGSLEKTVTLKAGLKLADLLKKTGRYRVVLTRSDDSRLALHQRYRLAREATPDLFISLHADANPSKKVRGSSVYTLSQDGVRRAAKEVLSEEDSRVGDLDMDDVTPELGEILVDFAQRETINASEVFATELIAALQGVTPLVNNTHRQKDLRVLLAPDVPAVLFELAFLSNKHDEANLTSAKWRAKTMAAVVQAIDRFFDERGAGGREASRSTSSEAAG